MSEPIDDGGPAFPSSPYTMDAGIVGMSLRDWFAGHALAGMQSSVSCNWTSDQFAHQAYKQADAMLAARKEKQ